jgi:hypothetical protein
MIILLISSWRRNKININLYDIQLIINSLLYTENAIKYLQFLQKWIPNSPDMLYHDDSNSIVGFYLLKLISIIATAPVNSEIYRVGIDVMQLLLNLIFTRDLTVFRSFFKDAILLLKGNAILISMQYFSAF